MENDNGRTGREASIHLSDCAVHKEPVGPCDCGADSRAARFYYGQYDQICGAEKWYKTKVERLEKQLETEGDRWEAEWDRREAERRDEIRTSNEAAARRARNRLCQHFQLKPGSESVALGIILTELAADPLESKDAEPSLCEKCAHKYPHPSCPYWAVDYSCFKPKDAERTTREPIYTRVVRETTHPFDIPGRLDDLERRLSELATMVTDDESNTHRIEELEEQMSLLKRLGIAYEKRERVVHAGVLSNEELAKLRG